MHFVTQSVWLVPKVKILKIQVNLQNLNMYMHNKEETVKDGKVGLQSKFHNLNAQFNLNVDTKRTDEQTQHQYTSQNGFAIRPNLYYMTLDSHITCCVGLYYVTCQSE